MTAPQHSIDITVRDKRWPGMEEKIGDIAMKTLEMAEHKKPAEISIVLADDAFVQNLNHHYRHQDKPTNVLSFPAEDPLMLGDVVLAYETVKKESDEQQKPLEHHIIHLIIHGILHLLGHDHMNNQEADKMESLEIRILQHFGVKNPYEAKD